jgi:hypothetical protein
MSSRRQRWGYRHERPAPKPTEADRAAKVFTVQFSYPELTTFSFPVLAFDAEHAVRMARYRLKDHYNEDRPSKVSDVREWTHDAAATRQHILLIEVPNESADRHQVYAERQAAVR